MKKPDTNYPNEIDTALAEYVDDLMTGNPPTDRPNLDPELKSLQALSRRMYNAQKDYSPPSGPLSAERINMMQAYRKEFADSAPAESILSKIENFLRGNPTIMQAATAAVTLMIVIGVVAVLSGVDHAGIPATSTGSTLALPLTILGVGLVAGVVLLWLRRK